MTRHTKINDSLKSDTSFPRKMDFLRVSLLGKKMWLKLSSESMPY